MMDVPRKPTIPEYIINRILEKIEKAVEDDVIPVSTGIYTEDKLIEKLQAIPKPIIEDYDDPIFHELVDKSNVCKLEKCSFCQEQFSNKNKPTMCSFCSIWGCIGCLSHRKRLHPRDSNPNGTKYNICVRCDNKFLNLHLNHPYVENRMILENAITTVSRELDEVEESIDNIQEQKQQEIDKPKMKNNIEISKLKKEQIDSKKSIKKVEEQTKRQKSKLLSLQKLQNQLKIKKKLILEKKIKQEQKKREEEMREQMQRKKNQEQMQKRKEEETKKQLLIEQLKKKQLERIEMQKRIELEKQNKIRQSELEKQREKQRIQREKIRLKNIEIERQRIRLEKDRQEERKKEQQQRRQTKRKELLKIERERIQKQAIERQIMEKQRIEREQKERAERQRQQRLLMIQKKERERIKKQEQQRLKKQAEKLEDQRKKIEEEQQEFSKNAQRFQNKEEITADFSHREEKNILPNSYFQEPSQYTGSFLNHEQKEADLSLSFNRPFLNQNDEFYEEKQKVRSQEKQNEQQIDQIEEENNKKTKNFEVNVFQSYFTKDVKIPMTSAEMPEDIQVIEMEKVHHSEIEDEQYIQTEKQKILKQAMKRKIDWKQINGQEEQVVIQTKSKCKCNIF